MGRKKRRKQKSKSQVSNYECDTSSLPPLETTDDENVEGPQCQKNKGRPCESEAHGDHAKYENGVVPLHDNEPSKTLNQLSGRTRREDEEARAIHSTLTAEKEKEYSSRRPQFRIQPFRIMVYKLERLLSPVEVLDMAQLTGQSPEFIMKIPDLDRPWLLLMANLEMQGVVTEDNFEALIDILAMIEATDALALVKNFTTTSDFKEVETNVERTMSKLRGSETSLEEVLPVQECPQPGASQRLDNTTSSTRKNVRIKSKVVPSERTIACSWDDVSLNLDSFGIPADGREKLRSIDVMVLDQIHLHGTALEPKNVLVAFFNRLMSYDYRSIRLFKELDNNEFLEIGKSSRSRVKSRLRNAHPSTHQKLSCRDIIHAIIKYCDPFLQQVMLSKMSECQLGVPVLLPESDKGNVTLLLWGLQKITKAWENPKTSEVFEEPVVQFSFPVVTAMRFGNPGFSKSNILNKILGCSQGNDDHPYFISHEQDNTRSVLSRGSLEAVWYLPSGGERGKRSLSEAICFLNLRGDAAELPKQQSFASIYSLITVVFISKTEMHAMDDFMNNLSKKTKLILVMGNGDESRPLREEETDAPFIVRKDRMSFFDASKMNALEVSEKICVEINRILEGPRNISDNIMSLADTLSICEEQRIHVDIFNEECTQAKKAAEDVLRSCKEGPKRYKSKALPLQLNWQEWSRLDKDRSWKGAHGDVERELAKLHKAKEDQRKKQREIGFSTEMQKLFEELSHPSSTYKQFLLFWLQHFLNETSFASLRPRLDKLKAIRGELRETTLKITHFQRNLGDDDASITSHERDSLQRQVQELKDKENKLQRDLGKKTEEFDACSLGFEHFVREFGQIYECFHNFPCRNESTDNSNVPIDIKSLPKMAAELLLSGQPLEIFDGDACHVPIKWVKGVLGAVRDEVGDASVYVISVIGIQSSGKSTLLNSMFGVRFAVSAGRCTRGVFLQLLRISDDLKEELECDYIAVIDTEGLKAPEKAIANRKNEDNELATFALCLSDMTVINIGGQTVGEDLSNILQISAHAFIRMKEVHLKSSCYLIQQFVADITAQNRNQSSTLSILQKLDQAVVAAALEERKQDQYRQFSDCFNIVNIDTKSKCVQYVPSLWRSSMSAPNHEYSRTVLRLKSSLLEEIKDQSRKQKISEFAKRIANVWNAIKQEDFVFNFRNTNEISQYNNFTRFYKRQQLSLTQKMMNWELEGKQKIRHTTADNVNDQRATLFQELDEQLSSEVEKIKTMLDEELQNKEYENVRQHSTFFFRDLELLEKQTRETVRSMIDLESSVIINASTKENQLLPQLIGELRAKVLTVAEKIQRALFQNSAGQQNLKTVPEAEAEIKSMFQEEWSKQMNSVETRYPTPNEDEVRQRIESDINRCIMESLQNTGLSKEMKELLNSHKLSAFCQNSPIVKAKEDIDEASRLIGRCASEITHCIDNVLAKVQETCDNESFFFSRDFVYAIEDNFQNLVSLQCSGCNDKNILLICLSCRVLQIAHNATKSNILNKIIKSKDLLEKLKKKDIASEGAIIDEVSKQLKQFQPRGSGVNFPWWKNFVVSVLQRWNPQDQLDENFQNDLRAKFNSDIVRSNEGRWYSPDSVMRFIRLAHNIIMTYSGIHEGKRKHLLSDACSFLMQEAIQSEKRALSKDLSWKLVQITMEFEAIELVDQVKLFTEILQNVLPDRVLDTLTTFSETTVDNLSRIMLSQDRRHSIDELFVLKVPTLDREKYDTIFATIHASRQTFLSHIKRSGVYNTNLIRSLVTYIDDLTRNSGLGQTEQSLLIVHVCSWALPVCIALQLAFEHDNSFQTQLEKEKERLYLDFKSLCEGACQDKIAAKSFCAIVEDSLKESLKTRVCTSLFERLSKAGDEIFCSRPRFLQVVLESLCEKENFDDFTEFLHQHTSYIRKWTLNFIASECWEEKEGFISIRNIVVYEIDQLIRETEESLNMGLRYLQETCETEVLELFQTWTEIFSATFESRVKSSLNKVKIRTLNLPLLLSDCKLFTTECIAIIRSSTKNALLESIDLPNMSSISSITKWLNGLPKELNVVLANSVRGCGSQCPFCKTFCDDTVKEHGVHMSNLHFPIGVGGWRIRSNKKLVCDTCTANVASDKTYYSCGCPGLTCIHQPKPYREYREDFPDWDIKPISDYEATLYWKWVLTRFNKQFAVYYNCRRADIPWGCVTKDEALTSIRNINS